MTDSMERTGSKRKRSNSTPPWRKVNDQNEGGGSHRRIPYGNNSRDQVRLNQLQEEERMREWVAQEDQFVLKQAKKRAEIRVRDGRAKPIDWLCCTLRIIDPTRNPLDVEADDFDIDVIDPTAVFEDLSEVQLTELQKDIETYMQLEKSTKNRDYWRTMQVICKDHLRKLRATGLESRAVSAVATDIDRLLEPKTSDELESLETQIRTKLASNEPIDIDYWQQLLDSLLVWKARSRLRTIYAAVLESRLDIFRKDNEREAKHVRSELASITKSCNAAPSEHVRPTLDGLDPEPALQIALEDKALVILDEDAFLQNIVTDRRKLVKHGINPSQGSSSKWTVRKTSDIQSEVENVQAHTDQHSNDDASQLTKVLFNKEMARGFGEDEEIFTAEEEVETKSRDQGTSKYRLRKPKYFNRVQMGYEWNKYNQTHYDHDNPPPKVVQGYKFHIFYPELIDKTKAPTYRIEREDGRKKGQSTAPAGEEDTCIIKFIAGPPYETIAFRIIDRDWDYSAKYDRGFRSTFDAGVLSLHFSFKKIYYRK